MEVLFIVVILFSLFIIFAGGKNFNFVCKFLGVLFFILMILNALNNIFFLQYGNSPDIGMKNDAVTENGLSIFFNMSLFYLLWMISKRKFSKKVSLSFLFISVLIYDFSAVMTYIKILAWFVW